jgi:pimeloyl-ACP methyl ester carboxylesterase
MTSQTVALPQLTARAERHRHAERAVWDHYGLEPSERFVDVDEPAAQIRVVEVGSGSPILVAHGTFGGGPAIAGLVRELPGRRFLLMDRPGFGLSSPIAYRAETFGRTIADLQRAGLDGMGVDKVDVVGHSIGALFALRLALHHPERVGRVILLGAGPLVQEAGVPAPIRLIGSPLGPLMLHLLRGRQAVRSMIAGSGHGAALADGRIPEVMLDWRTSVNRDTDSMQHERAMVRAIVGGSRYRDGVTLPDAELAAIWQPTLMVYGTLDSLGDAALWKRGMGALPEGELAVINDAGHMVWLDDPAGVARTMEGFLS